MDKKNLGSAERWVKWLKGERSISKILFGSLAALVLLVCATLVPMAQTTGSATLRGTVKDPSGAVVTKATVILINEGTKVERRTTSNQDGLFVFSAINPATYQIKIESTGFKTLEQKGILISPSDVRGLDFTL